MLVRTCPQTLRANVIVLPQSVSPVVVALGNSMNTLLVSCNLICTAAAAQIEPNNEQSFEAGSQAQCGRAAGAAPREVGGASGNWGAEDGERELDRTSQSWRRLGCGTEAHRAEWSKGRSSEACPGLALPFGSDASSGRGHSL